MTRYGITIPFDDGPLHGQRERFRRLVDLGYTDVWSSESAGHDGVTPLAMAAAWAPELRVGTAVLPASTRGPAVLAQTAASLADAAPAGAAVGIGASSPAIVSAWNAMPFEDPYRRTRDVVRFLRAALGGGRVDGEFATFSVRGFRLAVTPERPPAVLVAALRPGMARLAEREADGVILNWIGPADVATVVEAMGGPGPEVVARIMVVPSAEADEVRRCFRPLVTAYLTVPAYAAAQQWLGRGHLLAPVLEAWAAGDRARAVELVPDELVDALVVHGPPERCRDRVAAFVEAGVTTPVLAVLPLGVGVGVGVDVALSALAPATR